jgi:NTE family protein
VRGRTAIVLSGGGARGAYEAGVLSFIFQDVARRLGRSLHFDIITGTSVGAIHACYLAGAQHREECGRGLVDIWRSLSLDSVMSLSVGAVLRAPLRLFGFGGPAVPHGDRIAGLFDTRGLESLVAAAIDWRALRANVDAGRIAGLAVTATEIASGKALVFVDRPGGAAPKCGGDPLVVTQAARIGVEHALASAAIPMVFPAVRIGNWFYSDGGLRMNTPLAPALRMGAERVLVIGLRHASPRGLPETDEIEPEREAVAQSPIYLAGKALNALLLDRVEYDLERLRLFNDILRNGVAAFGDDFIDRFNEPIVAHRGRPYQIVDSVFIRPSRDLGIEAAECMRAQLRAGAGGVFKRWMLGYFAESEVSEADFLSYLYFDACYAERLVEMGRRDAAAMEDELAEFFS